MEKVNLPKGLIRYASEDEIEKKEKFKFTTRMKGYTAVLGILIAVLVGMLFLRTDVEATVLRLPGQLYEHKENNVISNIFTYTIINKTTEEIDHVKIRLKSHDGKVILVGNDHIKVPAENMAKGTLFIEMKLKDLDKDKTKIILEVYNKDRVIETTTTNFLGPRQFR
jgi:polyferredoxin